MTVCRFYLEGRCSYGQKCKYEHRQPNSSELNNRIGWNTYNQQSQIFEEKSIRIDLTKERPIWPYTVYAPAKEESNLIEGTDVSAEELRLEFFKLKDFWAYGGEMQYNQGVSHLNSVMKQKIDEVLKDVRGVIRTYQNKIKQQSGVSSFGGRNTSQQPSNTFGSSNGYSQPSQGRTFGQQQNGFGRQQQGGFGNSRFGQQNNYQQQPLQPSPFGQQPGPGFGAAQSNGGFGGFYQQQPQQNGLGLGTPQQPLQQSNTFGTFSAVGNTPAPASTFGQSGFGSASNIQQQNPLGQPIQNPLGQSIQNPFGTQQQPNLFGGGIQGAKPDSNMVGTSEYFTGKVPTAPPSNHY